MFNMKELCVCKVGPEKVYCAQST